MTSIAIDRTDGLAAAAAIKGPCLVATTANITLSGTQTIDGVAVVAGDRVLVKDQTTGSENGIYVVDTGSWRRAKDFNRTRDVVQGTLVIVAQGTANGGKVYRLSTSGTIVVGTTSIAFTEAFATAARTITAGTGLTGGGNLSQDRTIALNAASIASLGLADSAVQPNGSSGVTRVSTAAGESIDPGHFGGKFLLGKAGSKLRIDTPGPTDSSDGPRFALSLEHIFPGGTDNTPVGDDDGPDDCRGGLWLHSSIDDWLTTTNYGEPNLIYGLVQGGLFSDAGGILLGGYKVFDDAGGTGSGSLTPIEVSGSRFTSAGVETSRMQAVVGLQEVAGGALNKHGAGFWTRNEVDANNQAFVAVNGGAAFKYAFAAYTSQDPAAMYYAAFWNGNSVIQLGAPAAHFKFVHETSTDALLFQNTAGTTNLASLTQTGVLAAFAGVTVASGQATLKRVLTATASLNFASVPANEEGTPLTVTVTGAQVNDTVIVTVISGLFTGKLNYFGVVTSTNTVTIYVNNVSTAAIDPSAQTFRVTVLGF